VAENKVVDPEKNTVIQKLCNSMIRWRKAMQPFSNNVFCCKNINAQFLNAKP